MLPYGYPTLFQVPIRQVWHGMALYFSTPFSLYDAFFDPILCCFIIVNCCAKVNLAAALPIFFGTPFVSLLCLYFKIVNKMLDFPVFRPYNGINGTLY